MGNSNFSPASSSPSSPSSSFLIPLVPFFLFTFSPVPNPHYPLSPEGAPSSPIPNP
ncbi:hypothetical protein FDUTEX481_01479 [Tolypothrix sp. PCC 7601]|nr:hypothetical protein FDUTEX481_01479 [Tolypothrix sp. PCC 7601]